MERVLDAVISYPILGVGCQNFVIYSGLWREVHVAYLQIATEGGIPVLILYLMFFYAGFSNLRQVERIEKPTGDLDLFLGASRASLVGFVVGACFAPEAYQFFPYFAVCYTSLMLAIVKEKRQSHTVPAGRPSLHRSTLQNGYLSPVRSCASYAAG